MHSPIEHFREAIRAAGLTPPDVIEADGKLRRFASNGKRGDDAGYYVLHLDGTPAGMFGDHRTGLQENWRADNGRTLTPAEEAAHRKRVDAMRLAREAEEAQRRTEAASKATRLWSAGTPARPDHPYLLRKRVAPTETLRELSADDVALVIGYAPRAKGERLADRVLLAPVKVGGKLSTIEMIDGDGRKSALAGGAKSGGFWAAQAVLDGDGRCILIAEGVATALSAREATGHPAIAALSAGQLAAAARAMRERYPAALLVILADVLASGEPDPRAVEAARATGAALAVPDFGADRPEGATDFNDMAAHRGLEAVKRAVEAAIASARAECQPGEKNEPADEFDLSLIRASDITPEPVTWLWNGWLAAGKMHVLGGAPGTGKTTISMALAATISTGGRWPDGSQSVVGNVVIWSGEDDPKDTLVPRLALSGADLSRVYFIGDVREGDERRAFDPAHDMDPLRRRLHEVGEVRLLIVDPIVSAIAGDSHKNAEVRRALQPLADLAASMRCAVLGITHFSKGTGGRDPVERLTGSLAFGALARVVLVAAKHQEEGEDGRVVRLFCRAKSNIGPDDGGFEYDLHQAELTDHPGIFASAVLWGDPLVGAARELLATADATGDDDAGGTLAEAKRFLADLLADGPVPSKNIKADADGAGYSWATIRRAQKALGLEAVKDGMKGGWTWRLPAQESAKVLKNPEDAQQKEVGTFGKPEHLRGASGTVEVEI